MMCDNLSFNWFWLQHRNIVSCCKKISDNDNKKKTVEKKTLKSWFGATEIRSRYLYCTDYSLGIHKNWTRNTNFYFSSSAIDFTSVQKFIFEYLLYILRKVLRLGVKCDCATHLCDTPASGLQGHNKEKLHDACATIYCGIE